jgi:hypothetical protein
MKKRSLLDSIEVKKSCTQDWDLMYGNDKMRFCEHCVKNVHDLSAMTRDKAEKFIARSGGGVCVRYVQRPDGKIQTVSDKLYQISGRASRLAASVFGASLTLASSLYAQTDAENTQTVRQSVVRPENLVKNMPKETSGRSVHGTVSDANQAVIPGIKVTLKNENNGAEQTTNSDDQGAYIFSNVESGLYTLKFDPNYGFLGDEIAHIDLAETPDAKHDVTLQVVAMTMMGDIAVRISYENQLVIAVQNGDVDLVKQLIGENVDVNRKDENVGTIPLHLAVQEGKTEIVELLLGAGAKVNARDQSRRTPLMLVSSYYDPGALEAPDYTEDENASQEINGEAQMLPAGESPSTAIFGLLIKYGAKVDLRDSGGTTALMYAAQRGQDRILKLLLSHRADINARSKTGRTALMDAVEEGQIKCVRALLEAGANVDLKEQEGQNALSFCSDADIQQLLIAFGAQEQEAAAEEEPEEN